MTPLQRGMALLAFGAYHCSDVPAGSKPCPNCYHTLGSALEFLALAAFSELESADSAAATYAAHRFINAFEKGGKL
jgi:hypothetical protein